MRSFTPKEHVAGNAPMKSSAQRQIRAKVLEQIPFLSHPAAAPPPPASTPAQQPTEATHDSDEEEEDNNSARRKKGAGKDKRAGKAGGKSGRGGGKKGGNKRGGGGGDDPDEEATSLPAQPPLGGEDQEDEALTVLDLIWPKKETLSLVKWCVSFRKSLSRSEVKAQNTSQQPGSHLDLHRARRTHLFPTFRRPVLPDPQGPPPLRVPGSGEPISRHLLIDDPDTAVPDMLPRVGVDRGAIKFVLAGANIMWSVSPPDECPAFLRQ